MTKSERQKKQDQITSRVNNARIAAKITQRDFAKALNYTQGNIQQKMTGQVRFNAYDISCAAKLLNVSADYLLCLTDDPKPWGMSDDCRETHE